MTPLTRPVPTPRDLAPRTAVAADAPAPSDAPPSDAPPYDRHTWEQAVRFSELRPDARLVAMMLAHYARPTGIVSGDVLIVGRMAKACGLRPDDRVRGALSVLERRGYLTRPPAQLAPSGYACRPRPVTLTLPPSYRPPHPGPAHE